MLPRDVMGLDTDGVECWPHLRVRVEERRVGSGGGHLDDVEAQVVAQDPHASSWMCGNTEGPPHDGPRRGEDGDAVAGAGLDGAGQGTEGGYRSALEPGPGLT